MITGSSIVTLSPLSISCEHPIKAVNKRTERIVRIWILLQEKMDKIFVSATITVPDLLYDDLILWISNCRLKIPA
jgi:hypothetical protein